VRSGSPSRCRCLVVPTRFSSDALYCKVSPVFGHFCCRKTGGIGVKRRDFIRLLGGAAAAWPLAARAQEKRLPVVAILSSTSQTVLRDAIVAFQEGLKQTGHLDGQNIVIESYWAEGNFERLSQFASDLVQRRVTVIVTTGVSSSLAAKAASATIPQVFVSQDDPVKLGLSQASITLAAMPQA
jgi:ABC-type uncharacterized transport system substrate-binding protein